MKLCTLESTFLHWCWCFITLKTYSLMLLKAYSVDTRFIIVYWSLDISQDISMVRWCMKLCTLVSISYLYVDFVEKYISILFWGDMKSLDFPCPGKEHAWYQFFVNIAEKRKPAHICIYFLVNCCYFTYILRYNLQQAMFMLYNWYRSQQMDLRSRYW